MNSPINEPFRAVIVGMSSFIRHFALAGRISNDRSNGVTDCANIHRYPIRFDGVSDAMLSPNMFAPQANRPVGQTLLLGTVVIGTTMLATVILYAVTGWLWLVVHEGLH